MPNLPYMKLRGGVWYTAGAHPALELRPNGRNKAQVVATGLRDVTQAAAFSTAYGQFIRERWDPSRYGEARKIHEQAAEIYYRPYRHRKIDDEERQAEEIHDLCFTNRAAELAALHKNDDAAMKLVDAQATIESLMKELGKAVAGADIQFEKVADEYYDWGCLKGGRNDGPWAHDHKRKRRQQLDWWAERFKKLSDITLVATEQHQRALSKTLAGKTVNHYCETIRHLTSWCKERKYLINDPLEFLGRVRAKSVKNWRYIAPAEAELLLAHCLHKRVILYEVALNSGLRRNELRSLVVSDVDEKNRGLRLHAEWTKSRKDGFQPLPPWLVEKLVEYVKGKEGNARLLPMPSDPVKRFRQDLKRAGIVDGKLVFHSLRKGHSTAVDQSGGSVKTAQSLSRHASPELTYNTYVGAVDSDMRAAVEKVGQKFRAKR